jgi:hypothetical protein
MNIAWGSLGLVGAVSFAAAVAVVVLVSFALVGLSAREVPAEGEVVSGGMSPATGTAVAAVCLLAVAVIVIYGLYIIVA